MKIIHDGVIFVGKYELKLLLDDNLICINERTSIPHNIMKYRVLTFDINGVNIDKYLKVDIDNIEFN
jgi:hypothetical protein